MEFDQKDLHDVLKVHLTKVTAWLTFLENKPHTRLSLLNKFIPKSWPFFSGSNENQQPPTGSRPSIQSGSRSENDQQDTSSCLEDIRKQIDKFEKEIDEVIKNIPVIKSIPETQQKQSSGKKQKSTATVQVYDSYSYLAGDFTKAVKKWTRDQFKIINVEKVSDIEKDTPLLILCLAHSRLQPDLDHALDAIENLKDYKKAACVIIHMKEEFALPPMTSQLVLCEDEKYKNMNFIDAAFTKEQKYYECQMNCDAARKLIDFLPKIDSASQSVVWEHMCPGFR